VFIGWCGGGKDDGNDGHRNDQLERVKTLVLQFFHLLETNRGWRGW
jgi:hypothetical protein